MSSRPSSSYKKGQYEVTGSFMVPYIGSNISESSDDDEEEERDGFLDYRDMQYGDNMVRVRIPRKKSVELKDKAGRRHTCKGKFLMTEPYWQVKVRLVNHNLVAAPVYSLRSETTKATNMVTIFLSDCLQLSRDTDIQNGTQACFEQFCRTVSLQNLLTFTELEKNLSDYVKQEKSQGCFLRQSLFKGGLRIEDHSKYMEAFVFESDLGASVLAAVRFPKLVTTLSTLFPYSFPQILRKLSTGEKKLRYSEQKEDGKETTDNDNRAEEEGKRPTRLQLAYTIAQISPWEFCFKEIVKRKIKLVGVEATLKSYEDSGYLAITPMTQKDALHIYDELKSDAKRKGHVYMPLSILKPCFQSLKSEYRIDGKERWEAALEYLESNGVTNAEKFSGDRNIFLHHNWQAEIDTTEAVKVILDRHRTDPYVWDVDLFSPDFKNLRSDCDQLRACLLICSSPIVVMSGRGGCGKTTVITSLLKHLLAREQFRLAKEEEEKHMRTLMESQEECRGANAVQHHLKTGNQAPTEEHESALENASIETRNPFSLSLEGSLSGLGLSGQAANQNDDENRPSKSSTINPSVEHLKKIPASNAKATSNVNISTENMLQTHEKEDKPKAIVPEVLIRPHEGRSKVEILKRELVCDLLKILALRSSEAEDPALDDYKRKILLTAPTGKAARLLGCKAGLPSATLHSVLASYQAYVSGKIGDAEWKYSKVEILVVDECSLVSTRLFANVAKLLINQAELRKIVLLGDVRQLPSIEAGDFLKDMFKTLGRMSVVTNFSKQAESSLGIFNLALELTNNHRSESQLIVDNSELISCMKVPTFDSSRGFYWVKPAQQGDNERDAAIRLLLQSSPDLKSQVHSQFVAFRNIHCEAVNELCCQFYNNHSIKKPGNDKVKYDFRVGDKICLTQNNLVQSKHSVYFDKYAEDFPELKDALDKETDRLRERVKHCTIKMKGPSEADAEVQNQLSAGENKAGLDVSGVLGLLDQDDATFDTSIAEMKEQEQIQREKRKQRARQQQKKWRTTALKNAVIASVGNSSEKLCNGEVFFVMDEFHHFEEHKSDRRQSRGAQVPTRYLVLSDRDPDMPRVVCVPFHELRKLCKMRHSWARTIHTYQGSESNTVVYVLGKAGYQTWQHVYTAVTRGRKSVYVLGDWDNLHKAITRRDIPRRTRLAHRLQESLKDQAASVEICRKDFMERHKLYLDIASGSDASRVAETAIDFSSEEFGSDENCWLVQVTSYQEQALIGEVPNHLGESTSPIPGCSAIRDATISTHKNPSQSSASNRDIEKCSSKEEKRLNDSDFVQDCFDISSDTDSDEEEEEEESIFASLHKYRENKQQLLTSQKCNTSEDVVEEIIVSDEEDGDCILLTQTQFIEENDPLSPHVNTDIVFEDDEPILLKEVSNQGSQGSKFTNLNGCKFEVDQPLGLTEEQRADISSKENCNSGTESAYENSASSPFTPTQDPTLHSPPPQLQQVNGVHPSLKSPPKPLPEILLQCRDGDGSKQLEGLRTPSKRTLDGEHMPSNDLQDIEGGASPSKLQRQSKEVGSPFLQSFSDSLTFDAENDKNSPHRGRDLGESPFPARRKL